MRLTNTSDYHTAILRRIFMLTWRTMWGGSSKPFNVRVLVETGRIHVHLHWSPADSTATLLLPKLTGDEFIPLLREQHGGTALPGVDHPCLKSEDVAWAAQRTVLNYAGGPKQEHLLVSVRLAMQRAKIPKYVPLRVRKPKEEKEPQDIVIKRYERVLQLEAKWQTKLKLAQTKLRKFRLKRRRYEKMFDKRNQKESK